MNSVAPLALLLAIGAVGAASAQPVITRLSDRLVSVAPCERTTPGERCAVGYRNTADGLGSRWLAGATIGFLVGGTTTYLVLAGGGSTAPCNHSANQDAMSTSECVGLTALGGLVGAGLGALVGSRIKRGALPVGGESAELTVAPGPGRTLRMRAIVRF